MSPEQRSWPPAACGRSHGLSRRLSGLLAALLLALTAVSAVPALGSPLSKPAPSETGTVRIDLTSSGTDRAYLLRAPQTPGKPIPLVVALHGRFQTPTSLRAVTGFEAVADERGFVVAFPAALGGGWNAGTCCSTGSDENVADLAFLDDVISDVAARTPVDVRRVYLVGLSNGGMMSYRYGCERAGRIAGVGVVAGAMVADASYAHPAPPACRPKSAVALIHVHGTADTTVDPAGGYQQSLASDTTAMSDSVAIYASAAGCRRVKDTLMGAGTQVAYGGCATSAGKGVASVSLEGFGHGWTREGFGYDTTVEIWDFLHRQQSPLNAGRSRARD